MSKSVGKYQPKPTQAKFQEEKLTKINEAFQYNKASKYIFQSGFQQRSWLLKRGLQDRIDFQDAEIQELRKYFSSLDCDGSGAIGIEELEDPLIALGLVNTREEVEKIMKEVDDDKAIDFSEFLIIMKGAQKGMGGETSNDKNPIYDFFKSIHIHYMLEMSNGQLDKEMDKNIPFKLNVSQFRRRQILNAITGESKEKKEKGQKILQAFKRQLMFYKQQDKLQKGEDPNDVSLDQIPNKENGPNPRNGFPKYSKVIMAEHKVDKLQSRFIQEK